MANVLNHQFVSGKVDGPDATLVRASNWNAGHAFSGGSNGDVLLRDTSDATYGASWGSRGLWQTFRGLRLRTHPDNDVAAAKVMLVRADEIVLHDGARVADWDRLVADIATAGAGGLDTGVEAASAWYEAHAIRKSSDGTKNLLLHRAKDYFNDEEQTVNNAAWNLRNATGDARLKLGQSFDVDTTGLVEFVDVQIVRSGSPTGSFWLTVEADTAGSPSNTALATSDKLDVATTSTSNQWVRVVFRTPTTLTAGTTYWLVLQADYTTSDTNRIAWRTNSAGGYAAGEAKRSDDGTTWTALTGYDLTFKIYVTRNDAAVTMPAGYDQRALVGYVYNDSGSNFDLFVQVGTLATLFPATVAVSGPAFPTLTDLSAFVPPVPLRALCAASSGIANQEARLFGVPAGYAGATPAPMTVIPTGPGVNQISMAGPLLTEYQAAYLLNNTGVDFFTLYVYGYEWQ